MNKNKEVAKIFKLRLNEQFKLKQYNGSYKFTNKGMYFKVNGNWKKVSDGVLVQLINGELDVIPTKLNLDYKCGTCKYYNIETKYCVKKNKHRDRTSTCKSEYERDGNKPVKVSRLR